MRKSSLSARVSSFCLISKGLASERIPLKLEPVTRGKKYDLPANSRITVSSHLNRVSCVPFRAKSINGCWTRFKRKPRRLHQTLNRLATPRTTTVHRMTLKFTKNPSQHRDYLFPSVRSNTHRPFDRFQNPGVARLYKKRTEEASFFSLSPGNQRFDDATYTRARRDVHPLVGPNVRYATHAHTLRKKHAALFVFGWVRAARDRALSSLAASQAVQWRRCPPHPPATATVFRWWDSACTVYVHS